MIADYNAIKAQLVIDIAASQSMSLVKFGQPRKPILPAKNHAVVITSVTRENTVRHVQESWAFAIYLRYLVSSIPPDQDPESYLFEQADALIQLLAPYVEDSASIPTSARYAGVGGQNYVTSVELLDGTEKDSESYYTVVLQFQCATQVYQ